MKSQSGVEANWFPSLEAFSTTGEEFVVIDMPSLSEVNEALVHRLIPDELAPRCLVVYRFASRTQLRSLTAKGFRLLKGPLEPYALVNLLGGARVAEPSQDRYSTDLRLTNASSAFDEFQCNRQKQLSHLVNALNQFELYLSGFSGTSCQEERLHQHLVDLTGQARSMMERALAMSER